MNKLNPQILMSEEIALDSQYHFSIGEFIYRMSHLEQIIHRYFSQLFSPEYNKEMLLLDVEDGFRSEILLNWSYKIYVSRIADLDKQKKFSSLKARFKDIINKRKLITHGTWGWTVGGYLLIKSTRTHRNRENKTHFHCVSDLQNLNKECQKWFEDFTEFTQISHASGMIDKIESLSVYLKKVGRFVIDFSQIEGAIRQCVASMYKIYDPEGIILVEEDYLLGLLNDLSTKVLNNNGHFDKMKKKLLKLNIDRNHIIHKCYLIDKCIRKLDQYRENPINIKEIYDNFRLPL